jgi:hypothetical protein
VLNGRGWSSANKVGGGGDVVCCCEVLGRFGGIEKLILFELTSISGFPVGSLDNSTATMMASERRELKQHLDLNIIQTT